LGGAEGRLLEWEDQGGDKAFVEVTRGLSLALALIPLALVVVGRRGHRWAAAAGSSSPSADPTHILRPPLVSAPPALWDVGGRRRGWSSVCLGRAGRGVEGLGLGVVSDGGSRITATLTQGSDTPSRPS
jgi:hypothetical protein